MEWGWCRDGVKILYEIKRDVQDARCAHILPFIPIFWAFHCLLHKDNKQLSKQIWGIFSDNEYHK